MSRNWRLIVDSPAKGAWNMAVDEALMASATDRSSTPTLRLFSWQPACLSLGRAQSFAEVDPVGVKSQNWDIVRRPSGGRAILHIDELTYSISGSNLEPIFKCDIIESYLHISKALVRFLEIIEITPEINQQESRSQPKIAEPICFEIPSQYEITHAGKKIIGSAQFRKGIGVLQHGTIPLFGDITRITQALRYPSSDVRAKTAERVSDRATTLEAILGRKVTLEDTFTPFVRAFEEVHGINFMQSELSREETQLATELMKTKYEHPDWTERV
jgi:lipoate-protein ligase A